MLTPPSWTHSVGRRAVWTPHFRRGITPTCEVAPPRRPAQVPFALPGLRRVWCRSYAYCGSMWGLIARPKLAPEFLGHSEPLFQRYWQRLLSRLTLPVASVLFALSGGCSL